MSSPCFSILAESHKRILDTSTRTTKAPNVYRQPQNAMEVLTMPWTTARYFTNP
jgi:hypothetical protein